MMTKHLSRFVLKLSIPGNKYVIHRRTRHVKLYIRTYVFYKGKVLYCGGGGGGAAFDTQPNVCIAISIFY